MTEVWARYLGSTWEISLPESSRVWGLHRQQFTNSSSEQVSSADTSWWAWPRQRQKLSILHLALETHHSGAVLGLWGTLLTGCMFFCTSLEHNKLNSQSKNSFPPRQVKKKCENGPRLNWNFNVIYILSIDAGVTMAANSISSWILKWWKVSEDHCIKNPTWIWST